MSGASLPKNVLSSQPPSDREASSVKSMLKFHELINENITTTESELHQNRMKNLRKELDYLKETEWKYQPIEKYIGQLQ
ncbi:hypothetical protein MML48_1g13391 [Holotrichia oblita]|uniref:Uncharacterized protein n=4 Tax=Holotrichia oblita TaxID=644536 RepID=A0ACB9TY50_HOLOL|nr:hypothetical protein MML48_1g20985 [Holotrichia oblita]KAI4471783.1 hypothetical protein MML48_1g17002 [Holotrichia oblita]KAI4471901.1 hypothetical protein MML48_1g18632 [Holotrichia oblita]KAI4471913.1 hypothetical protein MML48_1g13391 [Holotrichia oblita]